MRLQPTDTGYLPTGGKRYRLDVAAIGGQKFSVPSSWVHLALYFESIFIFMGAWCRR
jgi:hypothetical protein